MKVSSTEELPVNVKISYTLDGKSIQPEDLSGKSGKLGIRFDYKNTTEENVTINGGRDDFSGSIRSDLRHDSSGRYCFGYPGDEW